MPTMNTNDYSDDKILAFTLRWTIPLAVLGTGAVLTFLAWGLSLL